MTVKEGFLMISYMLPRKGRCEGRFAHSLGMSLIEILVAILIVSILAILLLPSILKSGIAGAEQAACAANLRKVGAATLSYAADNNWRMLFYSYDQSRSSRQESYWKTEFEWKGYMDNPSEMYCPSLVPTVITPTICYGMRDFNPPSERPEAYINSNVLTDEGHRVVFTWIQINKIENPAMYPLYADSVQSRSYSAIASRAGQQWHRFSMDPASTGRAGVHLRHNDSANIAFVDGHVERMDRKALQAIGIHSGYNMDINPVRF